MGRKLTPEGAKRKAWISFARFIRERDPYCVTCGAPTTEAGHYIHNSDKQNKQLGGNELWYDERNINGQCGTCNRWKSGNLGLYTLYLEKKYGHGIVQKLYEKHRKVRKYTIGELLLIEEKYQAKTPATQE